MKKLRIGFDIDDVLVQTADALTGVHNAIYGTNLGRQHLYEHSAATAEAWGVEDGPAINKRINEIVPLDEWNDAAAPFEGAMEVLSQLKAEGCELFAVTGRPAFLREKTVSTLNKHYPGIFSDERLHMTDIWGLDGTPAKKITKLDIARELKLTHFVEDYLVHADVLGEGGITTLLFSDGYPWNQTGGHKSLIRINSWKEIGEFFENERREV